MPAPLRGSLYLFSLTLCATLAALALALVLMGAAR